MEKVYDVYIAACDKDGGIYHYKMQGGKMEFSDKTPVDRPMYLAIGDNKLYAVLREPFEGKTESGLIVYDIDKDGKLINAGEISSTKGVVACHLTVADDVYAVNYLSGSVVKMPDTVDVRNGCGPNKARQEMSHTHYVNISPDGRYVLATDLGNDDVMVYTKDLEVVSVAKVPAGHGARHLAYSEDGKTVFCVNELMSTVTVFEYSDGRLNAIETVSALPEDFCGENTAAAIRVKGDYVYVSNRGHDSVSCLKFENGSLKLVNNVKCGGVGPRDFDFVGDNYIVVTNQYTNNITVFYVDKESVTKTDSEFSAECPICVVCK